MFTWVELGILPGNYSTGGIIYDQEKCDDTDDEPAREKRRHLIAAVEPIMLPE